MFKGEIISALKNNKEDHLEGWDREGGRETLEGRDMGIYVCIRLIHFVEIGRASCRERV